MKLEVALLFCRQINADENRAGSEEEESIIPQSTMTYRETDKSNTREPEG